MKVIRITYADSKCHFNQTSNSLRRSVLLSCSGTRSSRVILLLLLCPLCRSSSFPFLLCLLCGRFLSLFRWSSWGGLFSTRVVGGTRCIWPLWRRSCIVVAFPRPARPPAQLWLPVSALVVCPGAGGSTLTRPLDGRRWFRCCVIGRAHRYIIMRLRYCITISLVAR